ncbi:DUF6262 family protein [Spirillospora sp. NPDC048911]|uniref:DUF6262 family protein n=1 Tax=Spirillospora sp. NPDC048911 TaxID=3364527 RepID=UPI0037134A21
MTDTLVPRPRTAAALEARQRATQAALKRVHDALGQFKREKTQPSVAAVARRAGVSRTFVYDNPEARAAVSAALAQAGEHRTQLHADRDAEREAIWRERALNAEDALKTAPRSRSSAPASRNSSARSATWKLNGPSRLSSASPARTPPSSSESASSPPTTAISMSGSKRLAPTCASKTAASPTSKPNPSPLRDRRPDSERTHHDPRSIRRMPFEPYDPLIKKADA